jgi:hypothetical protein
MGARLDIYPDPKGASEAPKQSCSHRARSIAALSPVLSPMTGKPRPHMIETVCGASVCPPGMDLI